MSFKFEFKIDYEKLTALLDTFLKSHSDELTSIMGQCLKLQQQQSESPSTPPAPPQPEPQQSALSKPLIGEDIPDDPLQNLFSVNQNPTRYRDRQG